ncbi:MAG: hypothetical protein ACSLFO_11655 [Acidimicrobiales bacterium]
MPFIDTVRVVLDEALGNRGAVRNCRTELERRQESDQAVRQLCDRISPAPIADHPDHQPRASA